jgi:hypothetical protein
MPFVDTNGLGGFIDSRAIDGKSQIAKRVVDHPSRPDFG